MEFKQVDFPMTFYFGGLFLALIVSICVKHKRRSMCSRETITTKPATIPSSVSVHMMPNAISMLLNPRKFMLRAEYYSNTFIPIRVRLLVKDIYIIRGVENMKKLWRESAHSSSTELHGSFHSKVLGMPKAASALYKKDNSGCTSKPHANSNIQPNNRIDYITHQVLKEFLQRPTCHQLATKFAVSMREQFLSLDIKDDWVQMPDLLHFFESELLTANLKVTYGSKLLELQSGFCDDFWQFSHHMCGFARPFSRWTMGFAHASRRRVLDTIKTWQRSIIDGEDANEATDISEPYWSNTDIRKWYSRFTSMDGFNDDAVASLYLGIIWVSNYNFILAIYWMVLEVFRDQDLLERIRDSLQDEAMESQTFPEEKFPLLHSALAETLRLHTEAYIIRRFIHKSVTFGGKWVVPANETCFASTHPAHQDESVWNTYGGAHPLDSFWAERFLVFPTDNLSGPLNPAYKERVKVSNNTDHGSAAPPSGRFSLEGLSASWIPFGGGPRACIGRHIAKQQILSCFVFLVRNFIIEVGSIDVNVDERNYGLGMQLPDRKTSFKICRRL
ncbi:unnamed protein product [Periconia digitata]|uniref:Cytochrome P450 n=1 Tax=Periconia digitata TaxID=1303443 RepID=A0A9W4XPR2_9PLEO|nr:unnamed protein product [Periconia digitata]